MVPCLRADIIELWLEGNNLGINLSPAFRAEIEARKQAARDGVDCPNPWDDGPATPPRLHLFLFLSRVLPMMAYRDPFNLIRLLDSPACGKFLECVWDCIGNAVGEADYIQSLEWNRNLYTPYPDIKALCLRFPPPVQENEVWMVAIVVTEGKKRFLLPSTPQYYLYTLESGPVVESSARWAVWRWDRGEHQEGVEVPPTDEKDFVFQAVEATRTGKLWPWN